MRPKDKIRERLKALCDREGGVEAVAWAAGLSAEALKQVLSGVKLPSGRPRGIGPMATEKLEAKFPGWSDTPALSANKITARENRVGDWPFETINPWVFQQLPSAQKKLIEVYAKGIIDAHHMSEKKRPA